MERERERYQNERNNETTKYIETRNAIYMGKYNTNPSELSVVRAMVLYVYNHNTPSRT